MPCRLAGPGPVAPVAPELAGVVPGAEPETKRVRQRPWARGVEEVVPAGEEVAGVTKHPPKWNIAALLVIRSDRLAQELTLTADALVRWVHAGGGKVVTDVDDRK